MQKQLVELTGTLEEERVRARRLQNERDVQQATAMSHKERERHFQSELENEKKKRAQVEQKLEHEREKNASLNRDLTEREEKNVELRRDLETQALQQSEKVNGVLIFDSFINSVDYMVSGTRDNPPPPRDNFTERLYGVMSCNSCPTLVVSRDSLASYIFDKMAGFGNNLSYLASGRRAKVFI